MQTLSLEVTRKKTLLDMFGDMFEWLQQIPTFVFTDKSFEQIETEWNAVYSTLLNPFL